ncbi:unnamed protein product [Bursaphelenchus xylophilus]|uniref:(pine wood nematode) hypothetical protein n=1 Tax=Bursaphelenchus xylophilus TaxID=6326 RepID=A0A1I7RSB4_BURXY|nr:unnamed protein product [Bursaphelenchus xylophilus]CAG9123070.1 unnamed protein product [Bursaphelenchus xylophilus]
MKSHVHVVQCDYKSKCASSLTRLEIFLLSCLTILVLVFLSTCALWFFVLGGRNVFRHKTWNTFLQMDEIQSSWAFDKSAIHSERRICTSRECTKMASLFISNMNERVDPCDDFYEFACGNYATERELGANRPMRHTIIDAQSYLNKQIAHVLRKDIKDTEKPWDRMTKTYFAKCMDESEIERTGKESILGLLDKIGGWPVLQKSWTEYNSSHEVYLARVMNLTSISSIFFELTVSHNPKNSSETIIELDQPKFGLGSRWPYLEGLNNPTIKNYTHLITETAVLLGAEISRAEKEMKEIVDLECKLALISSDDADRGDPDRGNNPYTIKHLKLAFPELDFAGFMKVVLDGYADVLDSDTVIIREVSYMKRAQNLLKLTPKRVIANYISWRIVQGITPLLPNKLRQLFYEFKANQTGMVHMAPEDRWVDCVNLAVILFDIPVGKLFVDNYFDEKFAIPKVKEMTDYFKSTFIKQLYELNWMDEATKQKAIKKSHMIQYKLGYPPEMYNDTWMNLNWNLTPTSIKETVLEFTIRVKRKRLVDELMKYKRPVDRDFWYQSPAQVDAFYAPNLNEMIFPAGILQYPFLESNVPNYVTFAMVGAVISHELTHAFCSQGSRYDEFGNLNDWWDMETAGKYFDKADCFVKQYEDEKIPELNGQRLNGRLSLGENIADNGGVKTAFRAYSAWKSETEKTEPALPGLQNFTNEQLFFIAYANNWCSMVHPDYAGQLLTGDVHAPARLRAVIPLRNRAEFSRVYKCPLGSRMNPQQKCSLW